MPIRSYLGSMIIIFTYIGVHDKKFGDHYVDYSPPATRKSLRMAALLRCRGNVYYQVD
jgi:hypothetical protein